MADFSGNTTSVQPEGVKASASELLKIPGVVVKQYLVVPEGREAVGSNVSSFCFSPSGKQIAAVRFRQINPLSGKDNGQVQTQLVLWDVPRHQSRLLFSKEGNSNMLAGFVPQIDAIGWQGDKLVALVNQSSDADAIAQTILSFEAPKWEAQKIRNLAPEDEFLVGPQANRPVAVVFEKASSRLTTPSGEIISVLPAGVKPAFWSSSKELILRKREGEKSSWYAFDTISRKLQELSAKPLVLDQSANRVEQGGLRLNIRPLKIDGGLSLSGLWLESLDPTTSAVERKAINLAVGRSLASPTFNAPGNAIAYIDKLDGTLYVEELGRLPKEPIISAAITAAERSELANRIQEIGKALEMYAYENGGHLPSQDNIDLLAPYLANHRQKLEGFNSDLWGADLSQIPRDGSRALGYMLTSSGERVEVYYGGPVRWVVPESGEPGVQP